MNNLGLNNSAQSDGLVETHRPSGSEILQVTMPNNLQRTSAPVMATGFRTGLALFGFIYLLFVIYGSLVPLIFRTMPLTKAIEAFKNIPFLELGIGSRADWVANLLLFMPLAFFLVRCRLAEKKPCAASAGCAGSSYDLCWAGIRH
jgi:hypothetical protein